MHLITSFLDLKLVHLVFVISSFLLAFIYEYFYFRRRIKKSKQFLSDYKSYLEEKEVEKFIEEIPAIKELFKEASIKSPVISEMEFVGYGYAKPVAGEVIDNLHYKRSDYVQIALQMFHRLVGHFKYNLEKRLSLGYWIEVLVNLPKFVLSYLGLPVKDTFVRALTLIYRLLLLLVFAHESVQALEWIFSVEGPFLKVL
jgi:hypothetical protein